MLCIWHKDESKEFDEAHIIPEALGCPENFLLRNGEECKNCNNRLAYVDRALIDSFDVLRFHVGQPTKKGKPPQVTGRPNLFASFDTNGPTIEVNLGKSNKRTSTGKNLSPGKGRPGGVAGSVAVNGQEALLTLKVPIAHQPLLSRAIHKVALASLVKLISHEHVLNPTYDPVRDFVLQGVGSREVLMLSHGEWSYRHAVGPVYSSPQG